MQLQNPLFFYAIQVDQDGKLTNLFLGDNLSKFDYDNFGDVLMFDIMCCTNKFKIICACFMRVNHH